MDLAGLLARRMLGTPSRSQRNSGMMCQVSRTHSCGDSPGFSPGSLFIRRGGTKSKAKIYNFRHSFLHAYSKIFLFDYQSVLLFDGVI